MSRFDGVVAREIPFALRASLRQRVITEAAVEWIGTELRAHCPRKGKTQQSACVIATSGAHIAAFFAKTNYYSNPVINPEAAHYASVIAESSGFRGFVTVAKFDRLAPAGLILFGGDENERIAEYAVWSGKHRMDAQLIQFWKNGNHRLSDLTDLLPHPKGGTTKRRATHPKILRVIKQFPAKFTHENMLRGKLPPGFRSWCRSNLQTMLGNSRSDGRTRPGRKAHAACVVTPDGICSFGCNSPAVTAINDCCSERAAMRIAVSAGLTTFSVVAIASQQYPKRGTLVMCDVCRATVAHHLHNGNALVLYFEAGKPETRTWVSRINVPYAFSDLGMTFEDPLASDGCF